PSEYRSPTQQSEDFCAARFSTAYLEGFRDRAGSYCTPDSRSLLTCFHTKVRADEADDSLCIGRGAVLDPASGKFHLDCALRKLEVEEKQRGIVPFNRLRGYMYETGPRNVFREAVPAAAASSDGSSPILSPPKTYLLLKREGEGNPWHCLMEIFSTYMTFDVLRMSRDPSRGGEPFFGVDEADDTQVVILDEREDGPFFDLWTLFARRKPVRLTHLLSDPAAVHAVQDANIIVPLAGGSNPLWREEWNVQPCHSAPIVDVFSSRIRGFYGIEEAAVRGGEEPIVVTLIDRRQTRRLRNQASLLAALEKRGLHVRVQAVDFAALSFPDQVRLARETDVLVGVHGAGLTHILFMRRGAGAVVEIQPDGLDQKGYRNVANLLDLGYFRTHGEGREMDRGVEGQGYDNATNASMVLKKRDWHFMDVEVEEERFVDIVETAVKFMYNKALWSYDV
ncbi:glycosyltransferase family 61 protein, partial [Sodiomyces alcalophilus JCM 7366]|uniref:glycosyltransferase family 61 protein n=1 Tax=Sodiomyces alcalophilus JCM 7366 TaxID=591952 RepID=UPI0039B473D7